VFDIDAVKGSRRCPVAPVPEFVVVELLTALGLPDDYQWSYQSGSGAGWGVVIRCAEPLPDDWPAVGVYVGAPRDGRPFGQLELRWSTGQTVIDGAHPTGPGYRWRLGERPFVPPAMLSPGDVARAFLTLAEPPGLPRATATPSATRANGHARPVQPTAANGYGAAALADAAQQVATAAPGNRNNTLFQQTAALAELVNGGVLARPDVERAMTGAALAAGLHAGETAATVASAFTRVGDVARVPLPRTHANGDGAAGSGLARGGAAALADATQQAADTGDHNGDGAAAGAAVFRLDDIGNGERFTARHGADVRYDHSTGAWFIWTGTHLRRDDDGAIMRLAKTTARSIYEEAATAARAGNDEAAGHVARWARTSAGDARLRAMLNQARVALPIAVTHDRFNAHPLLLNVQNGTIDLETCRLMPHDRADLLTYVLPVAYDPDAPSPMWCAFIDRITGGNSALAGYLARAVGYTLSGSTAAQCLFFLYGRGANGKSTFVETIMALMGDLADKARAAVLMQDERERVPNEIAALAGRRLVVASELADGGRLNEGLVKDLTGGDTMSARFLYGEPFTFKPAFKLWLYGNHKPTITGTDDGIWRRVQLIPFTVQIPESERDPALPAKLRAELPGILAWAMRGWQEYQRDGLGMPAAVTQATADYRAESDTLGLFLAECCHMAEGATARGAELYTAYLTWAERGGLRRPLSNVRFSRALGERGFTNGRDNRGSYWVGIGLLAAELPS
jgi:putative DNA primase/helicase